MRIAIVTRGDLWPTNHGAAVKIVRTAEYLSLLGATVCVVTDDRERYWRYVDGLREEVPYGLRFRAFQEWPLVRDGARLAEKLCARVGYPAEETFLYSPLFDPQWWARVLYVGVREDIEVFQAEFPGYGMPCWLAAQVLDARSSIVQHNVEWDRLQDVMGLSDHEVARIKELELFVLNRVDEVIAVSEDDRVRMVRAGVERERITVLPHGVDTARYADLDGQQLRYAYGLDPQTPLLFFHGTLHYWPNTQAVRFIAEELLPRLLAEIPEAQVLIAGMNPPTYYQHPAITFCGPVADLPRHIAGADLTLCPVPSGGGTRMKILEYFAAAKACVATTKGAEGIRYTAGREIAVADDPQDYADQVIRLLRDPEARAEMGRHAQAFAQRYDWTAIAQATLDLYRGEGRGGDYNQTARPPERVLAVPREWAFDAHLPEREPSKPLTLLLLINRGCNLRCAFCDLWDRGENMPLDKALGLLDEAAAIGTRTLVITGGEPFIHPELFTVVRRAKELGMAVNITTNGTLIEKRWSELAGSGVDSLSVSVDGLQETHDRIRGQPGCHRRSMKGIQKLRGSSAIGLSIYFTVTNQNVQELIPVFEESVALGANFDFWPVNDAPDLYLVEPRHRRLYEEGVAHIAAQRESVRQRALFDREGLNYHAGESSRVRCLGLVDEYGVTFSGELLPCCVWGGEGLSVGNVFEQPLRELWASPQVQQRRLSMESEGCGVGCFNHSLYEYTRSTKQSFRLR